MHTYATNCPFHTKLTAVIAFIAAALSAFIGWAVTWIKDSWGFSVGGVSAMATFGILYFIFNRWLWRIPLFRHILLVPDLNGVWICEGRRRS